MDGVYLFSKMHFTESVYMAGGHAGSLCLGWNNDHIFIDFIWSMQRLFCTKKYQTECTMSFFGICGRRDDRSSNLVTSDTGN